MANISRVRTLNLNVFDLVQALGKMSLERAGELLYLLADYGQYGKDDERFLDRLNNSSEWVQAAFSIMEGRISIWPHDDNK